MQLRRSSMQGSIGGEPRRHYNARRSWSSYGWRSAVFFVTGFGLATPGLLAKRSKSKKTKAQKASSKRMFHKKA
jgi:hypothetical protein